MNSRWTWRRVCTLPPAWKRSRPSTSASSGCRWRSRNCWTCRRSAPASFSNGYDGSFTMAAFHGTSAYGTSNPSGRAAGTPCGRRDAVRKSSPRTSVNKHLFDAGEIRETRPKMTHAQGNPSRERLPVMSRLKISSDLTRRERSRAAEAVAARRGRGVASENGWVIVVRRSPR